MNTSLQVDPDVLLAFYTKELSQRHQQFPQEYAWREGQTANDVARKMFTAIQTGYGRSDWLKYNEALRVTCRKVGIKTSKEVRDLLRPQAVEA